MRVQFVDKVATCPLLRRQVRGGATGAVPVVVDVPPCDQAATSWVSPKVKVPQILFIVPAEDIPVVQQRRVQRSALGCRFWRLWLR